MQFNIQFNDLYDISNDSFDIENIEYVKSYLDSNKMNISTIAKIFNIENDDFDDENWYKYIKSDFFIEDIKNDSILLILSKLYIYLIVNKENLNNINIIKLLSKNLHSNNIKLLYNFINNLSIDIRKYQQKDTINNNKQSNILFDNNEITDNNNIDTNGKYDSYFYEDEKKDNENKRKDNVSTKNIKKKSSKNENKLNELTIKKYDNKNDSDSEITTVNKRVNSPIHQFSGDEYNYESANDAPVYSDDEDNNNILNDMIKKYKEKHIDDYYNYE